MLERLTLGYGIALVLTGIIAYVATGAASVTSLIPAVIGVPILLAGIASMQPRWRTIALWVAFALVVILAFGTLRGVTGLLGGTLSTATMINTVLFLVSIGYLVTAFSVLRGKDVGAAPVQ